MDEIKKALLGFGEQLTYTPVSADLETLKKDIDSVIVCGMGGSGVVGNFLQVLLPDIEILVHKGYGLPSRHAPRALYCAISYSGNTEETISAAREIRESGKPLFIVSGGGTLLKEAETHRLPRIAVPHNEAIPARLAIGYLLRAALEGLAHTGIGGTLKTTFTEVAGGLWQDTKEKGYALAQTLAGKTIFLYLPSRLEAVGIYWKAMLAETAKIPAYLSIIPEAHHNDIEAVASVQNPCIVIFEPEEMSSRMSAQFAALKEIARAHGWAPTVIRSQEKNPLSHMLNSALQAGWTSIALAEAAGVTSTKTPIIDELKKYLKNH